MHPFPAAVSSPSLNALSATELRRLIGTKEIPPVELLESCIARIEALDPAVNAIAAKSYARARDYTKLAYSKVQRPIWPRDAEAKSGLIF